jgi:hypothetical protein
MSLKLILAIEGPAPNVNSGRPYANDPLMGPFTEMTTGSVMGVGPGLPLGGIVATTLAVDETVTVVPSTIAVPQLNGGSPGINSGLAAPVAKQNATTIPQMPSQG